MGSAPSLQPRFKQSPLKQGRATCVLFQALQLLLPLALMQNTSITLNSQRHFRAPFPADTR